MSVSREKKRVLFICTHNAARSQMAEGLLRVFHGDIYEAFSAGTEPGRVNPYAIKVIAEIGSDIGSHRSNGLQEFLDQKFDYVVTVCDHANESCRYFLGGKKILHQSLEDPSITCNSRHDVFYF
jgi:arsenate reductase